VAPPAELAVQGTEPEPAVAATTDPQGNSGSDRSGPNRETLLTEIVRIATLFRTAEPNSPLGYTLEEAVRRARLGLPELLKEMMPDAAPRTALLSSLGIRPGSE
jgi:type VI secretion system protein ImpA